MSKSIIKVVAIGSIKPDPNQPRKTKSKLGIAALAENIREHGLINNIEIDKDNVIITGEQRFLACKELGYKEMTCKVVEVAPAMRFARQLSENIHQNTMEPLDMADGIYKLYQENGKNPTKVGKLIGKSKAWVQDQIDIVRAPQAVKTAIQRDIIKPKAVKAIKNAPVEFQPQIQKKLVRGEIRTAGGADLIGKRLKERPDLATEILREDYSQDNSAEVFDKLSTIAPNDTDKYYSDREYFRAVEGAATKLTNLLKKNPCGEGASQDLVRASMKTTAGIHLLELKAMIDKWTGILEKFKQLNKDVIDGEVVEV